MTENRPDQRWWQQCHQTYGLKKGDLARIRVGLNGPLLKGKVVGVLPGGCPRIELPSSCKGIKTVIGTLKSLEILPRKNEENCPEIVSRQRDRVVVINLKESGPGALSGSGTVYIGRQIEWRGQYLKDSPLRNPYRVGRDGSRAEVCEKYFEAQIAPAMEHRKGPIFSEIEQLATRVRSGERLTLACWCAPERCHGFDLAVAISKLAGEVA